MPILRRVLGVSALVVVLTVLASVSGQATPGCEQIEGTVGVIQTCGGDNGDSASVGVTQNQPGGGGQLGTDVASGPAVPTVDEWQIMMDCLAGSLEADSGCRFINEGGDRFWTPPPVVTVDVATVAKQASASLQVPAPALVVGPDPAKNKWGVLAVGLPVWVWADDTGPVSTTVARDGINIEMTATRGVVSIDWGDGTSSVCNTMTPRPDGADPLTSSPDCGHTYLHRGDYVIRATASWNVSWQAVGTSGTLGLSSAGEYPLVIREFSTVVIG